MAEGQALISGEDHLHLTRSMRAQVGDLVPLGDGAGRVSVARITAITRDSTELRIIEDTHLARPLPSLHLFQALLKSGKMDALVRQNVELGVDLIMPFQAEHSIARGTPSAERRERLQRIALEASKQSRRAFIPNVGESLSFEDALSELARYPVVLVAWQPGAAGVASALAAEPSSEVALVIGPEGGLADSEMTALHEVGGIAVGLGPNVLRADTAGLVLAAAVLCRYGRL
jgi:16S rRNA (uracil1498-N3)-methyltransferase